MNEVVFKDGDRVRVVRDTESLYGNAVSKNAEGVVDAVRVDGYVTIREVDNTPKGALRSIKIADLELVVAEVIEVGDVVKATHSSGSVVQGVVADSFRKSWVKIEGITEPLFGSNWSFEIVTKAVKPIVVGSVIGGDRLNELPLDTVLRDSATSGIFLVDRYDEILVNTYGMRTFARARDREYTVEYLPTSKKNA